MAQVNNVSKEETVKLIQEYRDQGHSLELLSAVLERSFQSVYLWSQGKRRPRKGDFELIKRLVEEGKL